MRRLLSAVLLAMALVNIAHADLFRPCQCGPDNPYSCGCAESKATEAKPHAPC